MWKKNRAPQPDAGAVPPWEDAGARIVAQDGSDYLRGKNRMAVRVAAGGVDVIFRADELKDFLAGSLMILETVNASDLAFAIRRRDIGDDMPASSAVADLDVDPDAIVMLFSDATGLRVAHVFDAAAAQSLQAWAEQLP